MHAAHATHFELLARTLVKDELVASERALVDTQVGQLAIATVLELEREHNEVTLWVAGNDNLVGLFPADELDGLVRHLCGIREEVQHAVEQCLHPLVLVG